jgi:hypothetical protein
MAKRMKKATEHLESASAGLQECGVDEKVLRREWAAQVETQTAKIERMSLRRFEKMSNRRYIGQDRNAGDKAINRILLLREDVAAWKKQLATLMKANNAIADDGIEGTTRDDVADAEAALQAATAKLQKATGELKGKSKAALEKLRGNKFVTLRMNSRALKLRIRSRVIAYKFEQGKMGKAFNKHEKTGKILVIDHYCAFSCIQLPRGP